MKILHIAAHLGGGVGKALSGLLSCSKSNDQHSIVCLEHPEKDQFIHQIRQAGVELILAPSDDQLASIVEAADIVQLEWWNHPATIKNLCILSGIPLRLVVWSHVSGLSTPIIPEELIRAAMRFLFTSKCSYQAAVVKNMLTEKGDRFNVASSCGGFDKFPLPGECLNDQLRVGYIGSLNFAKLHPRFVDFFAAVNLPDLKVAMIGDLTNQKILLHQARQIGKPDLFEFMDYVYDVPEALKSINVLAYLLNPKHYGTTENALLEAMAMGIVPIVMDNPAEQQIVVNRETGIIVHSPEEFAQALSELHSNPTLRQRMGEQAARDIRTKYRPEQTKELLHNLYHSISPQEKEGVDFQKIFGSNPVDWFLCCQQDKEIFQSNGIIDYDINDLTYYGLIENKKGSVIHFHQHFPENQCLGKWKLDLEILARNQRIHS